MPDPHPAPFDALDAARDDGPAAVAGVLVDALRAQGDPDRLFGALLLRAKADLGLPTIRPASFDGVPEGQTRAFEDRYLAAAREVAGMHADAATPGDLTGLARAHEYFRTIGEPARLKPWLEKIDPAVTGEPLGEEATDTFIQIALYEGVHPLPGLRALLEARGTCNTVTAADGLFGRLSPDESRDAAALLVDRLHGELLASLQADIERRDESAGDVSEVDSIPPLLAGRGWLTAEKNYHTDTSHLAAAVRFAKALDPDHPAFGRAIELAEYGRRLDPTLQYPAEPPFRDFYAAHLRFFAALADRSRDENLRFFREQLDAEPDAEDKPPLALVLVELLDRCGRTDEAVAVARAHLSDREDGQFSFAALCLRAGRTDLLAEVARERDDPVRYAAAVMGG